MVLPKGGVHYTGDRRRPQTASGVFRMPGYTGHVKGCYDTIGVTPGHAQYKAMVRGFSEMDPTGRTFVPHPRRDPCNDPNGTFKKINKVEELWPSAAHQRPASATAKPFSNKSHIVMGDDRFFQKRSHYSDSHADSTTATGALGVMDHTIFGRKTGHFEVEVSGRRVPTRLSDLSHDERKERYNYARRLVSDQALEAIENNLRLRLMAKQSNDNVNGKRMTRMFLAFDEDSSGHIDFEEFHKGLLSYGIQLEAEQALRLFSKYDPNADGYLSYIEFMKEVIEPQYFHLAFSGNEKMEKKEETIKKYAEERAHKRMLVLRQSLLSVLPNDAPALRDFFRVVDRDDSGQINIKEFYQLLSKVGFNLLPAEEEMLFQYMDVDKDGMLDFGEFCKMLFPDDRN